MSYLTELTVTYSALLDRMIQLAKLQDPPLGNTTQCSVPNPSSPGPSSCIDIWYELVPRRPSCSAPASTPDIVQPLRPAG